MTDRLLYSALFFFSHLAIWPVIAAPAIFLIRRRQWPVFFHLSLAALMAWLVSTAVKDYFYYPRPYIATGHLPPFGFLLDGTFPSLHTAVAFAVAFSTFYYHRRLALALLALALLIGCSRVVIGLHFPADVLSGALLGFVVSLTARILVLSHNPK